MAKQVAAESVIIAYIPVLHQGYYQLFLNHPEAKTIYVLSPELIEEFDHLAKEIRALEPKLVKKAIASWGLKAEVKLLSKAGIKKLAKTNTLLISPDEDVTRELISKYLPNFSTKYDSIFLRWDKHKSKAAQAIDPDQQISQKVFDKKMIKMGFKEAAKSSNWWRQVGAVLVKDDKVLSQAHNAHLPTAHQLYIDGDPRNNFHSGIDIELTTSIHAETSAIGQAAKAGVTLEGAELYSTTYPCPLCAKLIASSGIKRLYFAEGYGVLDGQQVLEQAGVEIIKVNLD